ncbi:MAG TPA: CPBP family glutamic-type intramembrane protease [Hyphomonadaceae bacterium]|nr:CPBP family glutamic-type intramembrane protease [Hyphomonadaceae bacterium]
MRRVVGALTRLPDLQAALEALILFLVVVAAGVWAVYAGVLQHHPMSSPRDMFVLSLSAFIVPSLGEEVVFRSWVGKGAPMAAVLSLAAYVAWHPLQAVAGLPFGRPEFLDPRVLALIAVLGLACTISRIRSGSIWPAVIIHWGIVVVWKALYAG